MQQLSSSEGVQAVENIARHVEIRMLVIAAKKNYASCGQVREAYLSTEGIQVCVCVCVCVCDSNADIGSMLYVSAYECYVSAY